MQVKIAQMLLFRGSFTETTTQGKLYLNGQFYCYTLEDACRGNNVKIQDKTAIPEGTYEAKVTMSNRFKIEMPILLDVPMFTGIRMHGGNTHRDTSGCILCAENTGKDKIWGANAKELTRQLKNYKQIFITIINRQE